MVHADHIRRTDDRRPVRLLAGVTSTPRLVAVLLRIEGGEAAANFIR